MSVEILFSAVELSVKILEYCGIIESIGAKVDRLSDSFLSAGVHALKDAIKSNDADNLVRDARSKFYHAIEIEKGVNLAFAFLGLALCHNHFCDNENKLYALEKIVDIDIQNTIQKKMRLCFTIIKIYYGFPPDRSIADLQKYSNEIDNFHKLKIEIKNYLKQHIQN